MPVASSAPDSVGGLPAPVPPVVLPAGDPEALASVAEAFTRVAQRLAVARADTGRAWAKLAAAWPLGPGRDAADRVLAGCAGAMGAESVACAVAASGLRAYGQEMAAVRAAARRVQTDAGVFHQDLAVLASQCPAGHVPAELAGEVEALHTRRRGLVVQAARLHTDTDDLARVDGLIARGYGHSAALPAVPGDQVVNTVADGDRGAGAVVVPGPGPARPHIAIQPTRPSAGAPMPLMAWPGGGGGWRKGGLPIYRGPGSTGGGGGFGRPGGGDRTGQRRRVDQLERSERKAVRSLQKRLTEHREKLTAYRADPDANDNKGMLRSAPTPRIRQQ